MGEYYNLDFNTIISQLPEDIQDGIKKGLLDIEIGNRIQDACDLKIIKTNGLKKDQVEEYFGS